MRTHRFKNLNDYLESVGFRRRDCGSVYFAEAIGLGLVKIGRAVNVGWRVYTLQTACPVPIRLLGVVNKFAEFQVHERFAHLRQHGEWFTLNDEIAEFLAKHALGARRKRKTSTTGAAP